MVAQIENIDYFCRKIDCHKTAYIFANATDFSNRQTFKFFPHTPFIPSVFVCGQSKANSGATTISS
jgi:hypothetical protein